jgi:hypothetical protein
MVNSSYLVQSLLKCSTCITCRTLSFRMLVMQFANFCYAVYIRFSARFFNEFQSRQFFLFLCAPAISWR